MSYCTLCNEQLEKKNLAILHCGHTFHLSCLQSIPHTTQCSQCAQVDRQADLGSDRMTSISADLLMKVSERRLNPVEKVGMFRGFVQMITPLQPTPQTFIDHMKQNKKLSIIKAAGFSPEDAVQERVKFADIIDRYDTKDIIDFGFTWDHFVTMGILPQQVAQFSWTQQFHKLKLNVEKMLKMRLTITELADMKYTTHQLIELGFTWPVLASMGANVDTWKKFNFELEDIKRYWQPTLAQWVAAGFYDKDRIKQAGWPMDSVLDSLPSMDQRATGRVLRLAF